LTDALRSAAIAASTPTISHTSKSAPIASFSTALLGPVSPYTRCGHEHVRPGEVCQNGRRGAGDTRRIRDVERDESHAGVGTGHISQKIAPPPADDNLISKRLEFLGQCAADSRATLADENNIARHSHRFFSALSQSLSSFERLSGLPERWHGSAGDAFRLSPGGTCNLPMRT
jgi:hypothetical protein